MKRWLENWYTAEGDELTLFEADNRLELWKNYLTDEELIRRTYIGNYHRVLEEVNQILAEAQEAVI